MVRLGQPNQIQPIQTWVNTQLDSQWISYFIYTVHTQLNDQWSEPGQWKPVVVIATTRVQSAQEVANTLPARGSLIQPEAIQSGQDGEDYYGVGQ
jgi:hypothetical protein